MSTHKQIIGINDTFNLIKKSVEPLSPLKEAITNSLDSIKERRKTDCDFKAKIDVEFFFKSGFDLINEKEICLDSIKITDNGKGFYKEALEHFKSLADRGKCYNNRGTGKIQIFHRFKEIFVDSFFYEETQKKRLKLSYDITDQLQETIENDSSTDFFTSVYLRKFYGDINDITYYSRLYENNLLIKQDLLKSLILYLFLEKETGLTINIKVFDNKKEIFSDCLSSDDIPEPDKEEKVNINEVSPADINKDSKKETIEWKTVGQTELTLRRFKLPLSYSDENGVFLCSKNILIEKYKFPILRKNTNFNGFRYLTSVSGSILDEHVKHTVDGFTFPKKKDIEDKITQRDLFNNSYIFIDEIEEKLNQKLNHMYSDLQNLREEKEQNIINIVKRYGINTDLAKTINAGLNDSDDEITKKLFEAQSKVFAKKSIEIQKTYDELAKLEGVNFDPSDSEYEKKFFETSSKLMELIPEQNKDELARYVIRRDMLVRLLKLALKNELEKQKQWKERKEKGEKVREEQEGLIHDLIFKRKAKNTLNDLWILNEEFSHFQGLSDLPLNELEVNSKKLLKKDIDIEQAMTSVGLSLGSRLEKRPDIFLYPEEGKCILIEFKAPEVDLTKHLDQISKYAKLIANYSEEKITQFYGFLIGENINQIDVPDRYRKSFYNGYWFYPDEPIASVVDGISIANIYQEIIPLSTIAKRAFIRNKSFSDKLGITIENNNF